MEKTNSCTCPNSKKSPFISLLSAMCNFIAQQCGENCEHASAFSLTWETATDMKSRQTIDRWAVWVKGRVFFYIYLCVARTKPISPLQTAWEVGHAGMLILNSAMPIVQHRGLLLTPSCLCIQHSFAGPPPGKQMAGNNTITHPEHWHPGPGLHCALCYLSVCIASEIPPIILTEPQPD